MAGRGKGTGGSLVELTNEFTVAAPIDEAWKVLLDAERVAKCMPGATLESAEGDEFTGNVRVKVGPIVVTYKGTAKFVELDQAAHRAIIDASGKESRGSGTAKATVTTQLVDHGDHTGVLVNTDLNVTGRPAQFGRGVIADVATKLTDTFAENLAAELARSHVADGAEGGSAGGDKEDSSRTTSGAVAGDSSVPGDGLRGGSSQAGKDDDVIDLLSVSATPVLKRVAPVLAAIGVLALLVIMLRRLRRDESE
jgi:carbon monoxide dehydrogenase subunit G